MIAKHNHLEIILCQNTKKKKLLEAICELNSVMDFPTIRIVDGNINEAVIRQATAYIKNLKDKINETSNIKAS